MFRDRHRWADAAFPVDTAVHTDIFLVFDLHTGPIRLGRGRGRPPTTRIEFPRLFFFFFFVVVFFFVFVCVKNTCGTPNPVSFPDRVLGSG
jgi:hypothetical protein